MPRYPIKDYSFTVQLKSYVSCLRRPAEVCLKACNSFRSHFSPRVGINNPFYSYWAIKLAYSHPLLIPNPLPLFDTVFLNCYLKHPNIHEYVRFKPDKSSLIWILPASLYANGRITSYASWPAVSHSVNSNSFPSTWNFNLRLVEIHSTIEWFWKYPGKFGNEHPGQKWLNLDRYLQKNGCCKHKITDIYPYNS